MDKEDRKKINAEKRNIRAYQQKVLKKLENDQQVTVKFHNLEGAEGEKAPLEFSFEGVQSYVLHHDRIYTLPKMVVDRLMERCKVPVYKMYDPKEVQDEFRPEPIDPEKRIVGYKNRFSFVPVELKKEADEQTQAA